MNHKYIMYNYDYEVKYSDDHEFRMTVRNVFNMNLKKYDNEIDLITNDENNYDDKAVTKALDYIHLLTKNNVAFMDLYTSAAALMLSTDPSIGLSILFSYDYLKDFHLCLKSFKDDPSKFGYEHPLYKKIKNKLTR